jgi:polysaccharide pyruvyl transferase WcaK-like protein
MTVTAFLGAYGYGNLGDELCLIEAMQAFPGGEAHALSTDAAWTRRCVPGLAGCFATPAEMLALRPSRVVFGGGMFGIVEAFAAWMPAMAAAMAAGAEIHLHNLGVARIKSDLGWLDAPAREVVARAASFTVRDYVSFEMVAEAGLGRLPRISFYPEADMPAGHDLAEALLPRGRKLLGISVIPNAGMARCLEHDAARVEALLAEFADHLVVPVVSTVHADAADEDDLAGAMRFLRRFLPRMPVAAAALLDRAHWRAEMTPARLKGIIARLDVLVTQRKHNAVHAIGAGTRVIGLHPLEDDSLRRTFVALSHRLPPGSRCVGLEAPQ